MTTVPQTSPVTTEQRSTAVDDLLRRASRPIASFRSQPNAPTYVGVLLATVGAVLLAVAWGKTAGTEQVSLQVPYVVSAGFTGLGLIAVGLTVVNLSAKARDAAERSRQLGELREVLGQMRLSLEEQERDVAAAPAPARVRTAAPAARVEQDHDGFKAPRGSRKAAK